MPGSCKTNGSSLHEGKRWPDDVGILAIDMYFPSQYVDQTELEEFDGVSKGKYTLGLGQTRMGFCSDREDINSLCLTVTKRLIEKSGISMTDIGFLMVGTETIVDKSKSVKSVLMQLFEESSNTDIEGLDTTNACYGGTAALLHAINWIESSSWDGRYAIVVAGDIAIYASGPARPTGGAGAVAMLVGPNAPLVLDRGVRTTHMAHTYDFYKPDMSSEYPVVEGKTSIVCYTQAVDRCYSGFARKYEQKLIGDNDNGRMSLKQFDALVFHSPYCKLVQKSVARMLFNEFMRDSKPDFQETYKGLEKLKNLKLEDTFFDREVEKTFLILSKELYEERNKPTLLLATEVGNMYTASVYSCLVSYLLSKPLKEIAGKRILMFSFGSGMAATMFSINISSSYSNGSPLDRLYQGIKDVPSNLEKREKISPKDFVETLTKREGTHHLAPYTPLSPVEKLFPGTYYLVSVDEMYRRKYERTSFLKTEDLKVNQLCGRVQNSINTTANGQKLAS